MLGALVKEKLWWWFLDVRRICKGKALKVVLRYLENLWIPVL